MAYQKITIENTSEPQGDFQNYHLPPPEELPSNIVPGPNGSVLESGNFQSPNYAKGTAGWMVDSYGNAEFRSLTIGGYLLSSKGSFGGDGSNGALNVTSGTTTIDLANATFVTKTYSSITIASGATLAFSNPATGGTIIQLKSQGAVAIAGTVTAKGMGAAGGAGGAVNGSAGSNINSIFALYSTGTQSGGGATGGTKGVAGAALTNPTYYGLTSYHLSIKGPVFLLPGAGGGGGAGNGTTPGAGGNGGGALYIECGGAWNFTGTLNISGADGVAGIAGANAAGGGGGGAPGTMVVLYNSLTANSGTVINTGGTGGNGTFFAFSANAAGGGGGGGYLGVGAAGGQSVAPPSASTTGGGGGGGDPNAAQSGSAGASTSATTYIIQQNTVFA